MRCPTKIKGNQIQSRDYDLRVKADKGQFDEALRRMLAKQPQKTTDIKSPKKAGDHPKSAKRK